MKRALVLLSILGLLPGLRPARCLGQQSSVPRHSDRIVESFILQKTTRLDALLRLGQQYRIPLGVEYVDREALTNRISVSINHETVASSLEKIVPRSRGYYWREEGGVLVISHRKVPHGAINLLNRRIESFESQPATAQELSNLLRMQLALSLNPNIGGFAGSFPTGSTLEKIGPLGARGKTVRELLNLIVSKAQGAAWITQVPVKQLSVVPPQGLWGIVSYEVPPKPLAELCCVRLEAFSSKQKATRQRRQFAADLCDLTATSSLSATVLPGSLSCLGTRRSSAFARWAWPADGCGWGPDPPLSRRSQATFPAHHPAR